jgi:hypothetical protein
MSDFTGAVFLNYQKGIANTHWSRCLPFNSTSAIPTWKMDLALAIASQACHAEHLGMCTAAKLVLEAPTAQLRYAFASASHDEAIHSDVLGRYVLSHGARLDEPNDHHSAMTVPLLDDDLSFVERAALHCFLEGFALDQFKTFSVAFEGDLLGDIYRHIRRDEARHVALGMLAINSAFDLSNVLQFDLALVEETSRSLGNLGPDLYDWLSTIEQVPSSTIRQRYEENHSTRITEIKALIERKKL